MCLFGICYLITICAPQASKRAFFGCIAPEIVLYYSSGNTRNRRNSMIVFYFSGTGNSRFVAERFAKASAAACYSIEEPLDVEALLAPADAVAF